eukprot:5429014-Amphidinium_carterae.1
MLMRSGGAIRGGLGSCAASRACPPVCCRSAEGGSRDCARSDHLPSMPFLAVSTQAKLPSLQGSLTCDLVHWPVKAQHLRSQATSLVLCDHSWHIRPFRADPEVVLVAVQECGCALQAVVFATVASRF